jgi:CubicO group peptidase (beta-lactamase class C family)
MTQVKARKELKIRNPVDAYPGDLLFFIRALDLLRGLCSLLSVVQSPMRIFGDVAKKAFANSLRENKSMLTQFSPPCMEEEESRFGSHRGKRVMEAAIVQKLRELAHEGEVLGCQVCVMHRDKVVANVSFGPQGVDDPRDVQPYTLFNCFSVTKAVTAAAVHVLVDDGKISYDSPVALYWPEFGEKNPETTVAELLSHRAGLHHAMPPGMTFESFCDLKAMKQGMCKLDADKLGDPKEASYHFLTFGWLVGGLVEAVTGMSFSDFVTSRITRPLGVEGEICIGIPEEWCHRDNPHNARLSTLDISRFMGSIDGADLDSFAVDEDEMNEVIKRIQTRAEAMKGKQENDDNVPSKTKTKGGKEMMALMKDLKGKEFLFDLRAYNSKKMRKACIPAANGHFSARALACFYHSFVSQDEGRRLLSTDTCRKVVEPVAFEVFESMDGSGASKTMQWGLGYQLYPFKMASGDIKFAFGHSGVGGSLGLVQTVHI